MDYFLERQRLDELLNNLRERGYSCIGPQVRDGAVIYDELNSAAQLPWGVQAEQAPGHYSLTEKNTARAFDWANGPQAIKPLLFKPQETLWQVTRDEAGKLAFKPAEPVVKPLALIGVRACDLAALKVQDNVFIRDQYVDERYRARRQKLFIVAVNCSYAGGNCFCVSTDTGPAAREGYDLVMTEVSNGFVIASGSTAGETVLAALNCQPANDEELAEANKNIKHAAQMQSKHLPKNNSRALRDILIDNLDHARWDDVASRCLSCGNCTSVCPTCFCHHETEEASIDGESSTHSRQWDSCFSEGHSYAHHQVLRDDTKSRYKLWLTHKLGTWWDQFDSSGCIGCGRCVTWCPVGIDITEEISAIAGEGDE